MDLKKLSRVQDSQIKDDKRSEVRLNDLLNGPHANDWRYYKNQLDKCSEDKRRERVQTWYKTLLEEKPEFAEKIATQYEEYLEEDIKSERQEARRVAEEERKAKEQQEIESKEAARPLNILRKAKEQHGKGTATYGMSDKEVDDLFSKLSNEMPNSGRANTIAGELVRAFNYLFYRWYNDGDWFSGEMPYSTYNPRSHSSWAYLCKYVPQLFYIYNNFEEPDYTKDLRYSSSNYVNALRIKMERAILNKIISADYDHKENRYDSREDFIRGHR